MSIEIGGYSIRFIDRSKIQLPPVMITGIIPRMISFPDEFFGHAVDVIIDNRDGFNNLLFRTNTNIGPQRTIGAGQFEAINDAAVVLLEISGPSVNWEVQAQIVTRGLQ